MRPKKCQICLKEVEKFYDVVHLKGQILRCCNECATRLTARGIYEKGDRRS